jgi:hypothetical protein
MSAQAKASMLFPSTLFLRDPANRAFVEGRARLIALPIGTYLVAVCLALISCPVLVWATTPWFTWFRLSQSGVTVQATVISQRTHSGDESTSYYVTYSFSVPSRDKPYTYEQSIGSTTYARLTKGAIVTISYLPENPEISRLAGTDVDNENLTGSLSLFTIPAIAVVHMMAVIIRTRRSIRLSREGCLQVGEISSCFTTREKDGDGGDCYRINLRYTFQITGRNTIENGTVSMTMTPRKFKTAWLPGERTPVTVLYVNDNLFELL